MNKGIGGIVLAVFGTVLVVACGVLLLLGGADLTGTNRRGVPDWALAAGGVVGGLILTGIGLRTLLASKR